MTNKTLSIGILLLLLLATGTATAWMRSRVDMAPSDENTVCTADAKMCSDGSFVGRVPPSCAFAPCPDENEPGTTEDGTPVTHGYVAGRITLSPTCPVERMPPDPQCAPKPYETNIRIYKSAIVVKTVKSDSLGRFNTNLAPGTYELRAEGGKPFPACQSQEVFVRAKETATVEISCDTGIR